MSAFSSKPPPRLHLHVDSSSTDAAKRSAVSPGSESSSHSSHSSRTPRPTPTPTGDGGGGGSGNGNNPACAACKYQRRKCAPDCALAPYFPVDQQRRFINAHRLFGVRNMLRTLQRIEPKYGHDAMRSLIYQSEARAADPVGGCVSIIEELRRQIHNTELELQYVKQQIAICEGCEAAAAASAATAAAMAGQEQDNIVAVDALYAGGQGQQPIPEGGSGLIFHVPEQQTYLSSQSHQGQQLFDYLCNNGTAGDEVAASDDGGMQQYGFADVDSSAKDGSSPLALVEQLGQHGPIEALPFVDAFHMKPQQVMQPAAIQHRGALAGDVLQPQQKLAAPVLLNHDDDVDEHMEQQQETEGAAACHLELGFSSF